MKQVTLTPALRARLQAAAGDSVDVSQHKVFESTALTTLPVRKDHPLFKGGKHTKNYLHQMATALNAESLPLQLVHNDTEVPYGRVFYCEVLPLDGMGPDDAQLRTLFWVDPNEQNVANLINSGTLDQVSVSTLAANAKCSCCGWDFMGPESNLDLIFSGTCKNGHAVGTDGNHVVMNDLGQWFEMSLVGRGGAPGARIHSPSQARLSLSDLSKADRDKLPDEMFAVPGKRKLPIKDASHVRDAWDMVDRTDGLTDEERAAARRRIKARAKELGIDTKEWNAGTASSWLTLTLDSENVMTLEQLKAELDALTKSLATLQASVSTATAGGTNNPAGKDKAAAGETATQPAPKKDAAAGEDNPDVDTNDPTMLAVQDLAAKVNDLIKKMTEVTKAPPGDGDTPPAKTDDAGNFLMAGTPAHEFAKKILVMSGDVEAKLPADPKEAVELLTTKFNALLKVKGAADGAALEAAGGSANSADKPKGNAGFKTAR